MNRDVMYIVYNPDTLKISNTFRWMGKDVLSYLKDNPDLLWINVTHPKHKSLLDAINKANDTNYF